MENEKMEHWLEDYLRKHEGTSVTMGEILEAYARHVINETVQTAKAHMDTPEDFDQDGTVANTLNILGYV